MAGVRFRGISWSWEPRRGGPRAARASRFERWIARRWQYARDREILGGATAWMELHRELLAVASYLNNAQCTSPYKAKTLGDLAELAWHRGILTLANSR